MFKPSITVFKPAGTGEGLKILAVSEDADDALKAYYKVEDPGEVICIIRGEQAKHKVNRKPLVEVTAKPKPAAKKS